MIEPDRLISPDISASEERYDRALRPGYFRGVCRSASG
jgi:hypothetical protein